MTDSFPLAVSKMSFPFLTRDPEVFCEMSALCEPFWDVKIVTLDMASTHEDQQ